MIMRWYVSYSKNNGIRIAININMDVTQENKNIFKGNSSNVQSFLIWMQRTPFGEHYYTPESHIGLHYLPETSGKAN